MFTETTFDLQPKGRSYTIYKKHFLDIHKTITPAFKLG